MVRIWVVAACVVSAVVAQGQGTFSGRVSASMLTVRAAADATVAEVMVTEGQRVKKGEILVRMDSRREEALFAIARAKLEAAQANLARITPLHQNGSVSREEVERAAAAVTIGKAEMMLHELDLAATRVVSVLDGVVTQCAVQPGQVLSRGAELLTIVRMDELTVEFRAADKDVAKLAAGQKLELTADAAGDKRFAGVIVFVSPVVDEKSGTTLVKGRLAPDEALRPGMAVRVTVSGSVEKL